jgi:hypothetical protein
LGARLSARLTLQRSADRANQGWRALHRRWVALPQSQRSGDVLPRCNAPGCVATQRFSPQGEAAATAEEAEVEPEENYKIVRNYQARADALARPARPTTNRPIPHHTTPPHPHTRTRAHPQRDPIASAAATRRVAFRRGSTRCGSRCYAGAGQGGRGLGRRSARRARRRRSQVRAPQPIPTLKYARAHLSIDDTDR